MKLAVWVGLIVGTIVGGSIPMLWGNYDYISPTYAFFCLIGEAVGVFVAVKIVEFLGEEVDEKK